MQATLQSAGLELSVGRRRPEGSPPADGIEPEITQLLNDLEQSRGDVVLDDFHTLTAEAVVTDTSFG